MYDSEDRCGLSSWCSLVRILAVVAFVFFMARGAMAAGGPTISTQPQNQTNMLGANAIFTVAATGQIPLFYLWSFNGTNLTNSIHISGATNATMMVSNVAPADAGSYHVVVSNSHGSVTSSNATLTVLVPAGLAAQPANQATYVGARVLFSVSATGTAPLSFQWYFGGAPLADNAQISGSGTANLQLSTVSLANEGNYWVVVTNNYGSITSVVAALVVTNRTYYVNASNASPMPPFTSWDTAATNIQDAVDVSVAGDTILVTNGTYSYGSRVTGATTNCVVVTNAISISGVSGAAQTIIDGSGTNRCIYLAGGAVLTGFTLTNGATTENGGGVYCQTTNEIVAGCILTGNKGGLASGLGGGAYQGTLLNCLLTGNVADDGGGAGGSSLSNCVLWANTAIYGTAQGGGAMNSTLTTCVISNNSAFHGGGVYGCTLFNCVVVQNGGGGGGGGAEASTLVFCSLLNNQAPAGGGANTSVLTNCNLSANLADNLNSGGGGGANASSLYNCLLAGNKSFRNAGGAAASTLINCTVAGNSAFGDGGGVDSCFLTNSVVCSNSSSGNGNYSGTNYMSWCCTTPLPNASASDVVVGTGNLSSPAVFADAADGDYRLYPTSPGIDAGNNAFVLSSVDLNGNPRIVNGTVDMGAYEYQNLPEIGVQPVNQAVSYSESALFSVIAAGTGTLSYQWLFNGTNISGATNASFTIGFAHYSDAGSYSIVIANNFGSVTSLVASLTVTPPTPPTLTTQPVSQSALLGGTVVFSISATGTRPLIYQWQENGTNLSSGGRLNGATSATLNISNIRMSDIGNYQVVVTNGYGMVTSAVAALSVVPVVAWGYNPNGQATVPLDFTNVIAVDADNGESMALRGDGTVTDWPPDPNTVPPAGLSGVEAVAKGLYACLALQTNGTITGWGQNPSGQSVPPGGLANVVAISAGNDHSLALGSDGQVTDWGYYWEYYFGGVTPGAGMTNLMRISGRSDHSLAVREDGIVFGWGRNNSSQAAVPPGLSNVVSVSVGRFHSLVLKSDGTVFAWGYNYNGQANIPAGLSNVVEIAAGDVHNLALRSDGSVVGWGDNSYGESSVPTVLSNVVSIDAGNCYSLAIVQNPTVQIPPSVWWQGTTNRILTAGGTTIFHPMVNGSWPMNFQWYFNGAPLAGQTNRWLALLSTATQQSGNYYFTVNNQYGEATSMVSTVSEAPALQAQPVNQSIVLGSNVTFQAVAAGDATLGYQWYFNGVPLADGGRVSGTATANLSVAAVQTNDGGGYQLVVTNNSGVATSAVATLTVLVPAVIAVQPTNRTVVTGSNVMFSVIAGGTAPFGYLWYSNGIALSNVGRISGATSTNLTLANVQTNDNGTVYEVVVTNNYGSVTSAVAMLTVLAPAQIVGQPASETVLLGGNAMFTVTAAGSTPMGYQWYFNGGPLADGGRISGSATATLTIAGVQSGDAGGYLVVITNPVGVVTSLTASLTVQASLGSSIRYVALTCTNPAPPYLDWSTAATNIQDAVDAAVAGDEVLVSNGLYNTGLRVVYGFTNRVVVNKAIAVQSLNGPAATTIQGLNGVFTAFHPGRCAYLTNGASLIGFTLTAGAAPSSGDVVLGQSGGGVWCEAGSVVISNCVFSGNSAYRYGGGVFRGTLFNCVLTNNSAAFGGGAASNNLFNCTLFRNLAGIQNAAYGGGAMGCTLSNCLLVANQCSSAGGGGGAAFSALVGCVLSNNIASQYGGGVFMGTASYSLISSNRAYLGGGAGSNVLTECVLRNNFAAGSTGGGAYVSVLLGCTVVSNTPGIWGGTATNCIIFYNNTYNTQDAKSVAESCTTPTAGLGPGDITNAPVFVNLAGGDYHLQSNSPCINAGLNAAVTVSNDFDGNVRIAGGTVDMGAYEYQTPASVISYAYLQQYGLPTDGSVDYLDLDGTGMNDWQKWIAGLNPTNPASVLVMIPPAAPPTNTAGVTVTWESVNTRSYYIQRASSLAPLPGFTTIQSNLVGQAGATSFIDASATNGGPYFYRVGVQ